MTSSLIACTNSISPLVAAVARNGRRTARRFRTSDRESGQQGPPRQGDRPNQSISRRTWSQPDCAVPGSVADHSHRIQYEDRKKDRDCDPRRQTPMTRSRYGANSIARGRWAVYCSNKDKSGGRYLACAYRTTSARDRSRRISNTSFTAPQVHYLSQIAPLLCTLMISKMAERSQIDLLSSPRDYPQTGSRIYP